MIATKRKIETYKDRFGGFSSTYNTDLLSQSVASPSMVEPLYEEVPQEVFEVEKEYKMDDELSSAIDSSKSTSMMQTIERTDKKSKTETYKANTKLKINAHGKVILAVFSCIVCLLVGFSIYNAVVISNINSEILIKQSTVSNIESEIDGIETNIENMSSETSINSKLDNSFRKVKDSDKIYLEETEKSEVITYEKTTNFFDKICEFFSNMF